MDALVPAVATTPVVAAFLAGRNARTMAAYSADLADFRTFVGAADLDTAARELLARPLGDANALALAYRAHLIERGLAAATTNRRMSALRALVRLARTLGIVTWTLEVPGLRSQPYRDTRGPGSGGVDSMLAVLAGRTDPKAIRDRAITRLLYERGLRRGEVVSLDLEHLDLAAGTLAVLGKGRSERELLTLPASTLGAMREWLTARGSEPGPLFPNLDRGHQRRRLTGAGVYQVVRSLGDSVGIKARPHGLRHAAITTALDRTGGDLRAVQRFSRHKDVRTVGLYDDDRQDLGGKVARLVAGEAA